MYFHICSNLNKLISLRDIKMDIKEFRSGYYKQQYKYKSFLPTHINNEWQISDLRLINLLAEASNKLGELNAYSQLVPDVDFFIKMHISKEATTSSRIEGTRTNISDALQKIINIDPEKRDDWLEVNNYINAMTEAIKLLKVLPISSRLIKQVHFVLLQGVRGESKQPGEFRTSQNWIGGASINDAVFIPPAAEDLPELLSDLEKFINNENNQIPQLVKSAIIHYQFETIHPFLDGNGRIGRLLITLYLVNNGLLSKPVLYLSDYFEKNRSLYYDNLNNVRLSNDLYRWLLFFLEGIRVTASHSIDTLKKIVELRRELESQINDNFGKKIAMAHRLLIYLYSNPIVDISEIANELSINISTANRIINDFLTYGYLSEITGYKRNRLFKFKRYIDLFE
jgi:Fic family protein